jgi:hypothetical protein
MFRLRALEGLEIGLAWLHIGKDEAMAGEI